MKPITNYIVQIPVGDKIECKKRMIKSSETKNDDYVAEKSQKTEIIDESSSSLYVPEEPPKADKTDQKLEKIIKSEINQKKPILK